jgi:hypothetical protein
MTCSPSDALRGFISMQVMHRISMPSLEADSILSEPPNASRLRSEEHPAIQPASSANNPGCVEIRFICLQMKLSEGAEPMRTSNATWGHLWSNNWYRKKKQVQ